jgi:hypothetical protein
LSGLTVAAREFRRRLKSAFFSGIYTGYALSFGPAKAVQRKRCRATWGRLLLVTYFGEAQSGKPD